MFDFVDDQYKADPPNTRYGKLSDKEIDVFCEKFKGDKDSQNLAKIYESKVPRIFFDVEAIVRGMRAKYTGGL